MQQMLEPTLEITGALLAIACFSYWYWKAQDTESFVALCIGIGGLLAAVVRLGYLLGRKDVTEKEREDIYERKKTACQKARKQIKNEMRHFQAMLSDPSSRAGQKHGEVTPFELVAERMKPLLAFREYAEKAEWISDECERNLNLPSGQKDVRTLVPLLKELLIAFDEFLGIE